MRGKIWGVKVLSSGNKINTQFYPRLFFTSLREVVKIPIVPGNYPRNLIKILRAGSISSWSAIHTPQNEKGIVLVLDIRNFTPIMRRSADKTAQSFLSNFFEAAGSEIQKNEGFYINKLLGDGLLAHFPETEEIKSEIALGSTVIKVAEELMRIFTGLKTEYNFKLCNLSIAVAKSAYLLTTVGKESYVDYTLLGTEINFIFRLLSATEGGLIFVPDNYITILNTSHWYVLVGTKYFKGIIPPVACYSVIREKNDEEKKKSMADTCEPDKCGEYNICVKAMNKGLSWRYNNVDYIFTLDCNECGKNKCENWEMCHTRALNVKEGKVTECCHICSNFRNCFHNYQLGRQGEKMITCNPKLKELKFYEELDESKYGYAEGR